MPELGLVSTQSHTCVICYSGEFRSATEGTCDHGHKYHGDCLLIYSIMSKKPLNFECMICRGLVQPFATGGEKLLFKRFKDITHLIKPENVFEFCFSHLAFDLLTIYCKRRYKAKGILVPENIIEAKRTVGAVLVKHETDNDLLTGFILCHGRHLEQELFLKLAEMCYRTNERAEMAIRTMTVLLLLAALLSVHRSIRTRSLQKRILIPLAMEYKDYWTFHYIIQHSEIKTKYFALFVALQSDQPQFVELTLSAISADRFGSNILNRICMTFAFLWYSWIFKNFEDWPRRRIYLYSFFRPDPQRQNELFDQLGIKGDEELRQDAPKDEEDHHF